MAHIWPCWPPLAETLEILEALSVRQWPVSATLPSRKFQRFCGTGTIGDSHRVQPFLFRQTAFPTRLRSCLELTMELTDLAWPAVAALPRTTPVIFPIAALEQHGKHMPVFTDSLLLGEVIRRVKLTPVANQCLFAPLQWLGNSHHHMDFPGTLSATPRLYLDMLKDLATCFIKHGFTRILSSSMATAGTSRRLSASPLRAEAGSPHPAIILCCCR